MINFLHSYQPQAILLQLGWMKIHWYGVLIAIGALLGVYVVLYIAKKYSFSKEHVYNLVFYLIIFGLIGDRLYYVFYAWDYYSENLLDIFKIWQGGLAIHGAMIAGIIVVYLYAKKHRLNPWFIADLSVIAMPIAMAFGRWGNYFNMELFGKPTDLPWGIPILEIYRPVEYIGNNFFHPTFLYESLANLLIFIIIISWHLYRIKKIKNLDTFQGWGNIAIVYFILYSIVRFSNEFLRIDYTPFFMGIRWAQLVSVIVIIICIIVFLSKLYYNKRIKSSD